MKIRKYFFTILFILMCVFSNAQDKTLKEQALDEFKNEHYDNAIALMEKAKKENPNDAEVYFYLGWFNHYRAYDSRPLQGYDFSYSKKIFDYFDKALELNPNFNNAKYFYGVECSANAFEAMKNYDAKKIKYFYQKAYEKGAFPAWLVEIGKNMLNSCDKNAILFTGGNADFDICMYLQNCQDFRKDITIISLGVIDRPWLIKFYKNGLKNSVRKINLNLTDKQILDLHPFKWKSTEIKIDVSDNLKREFNLPENYQMQWTVEPDLSEKRSLVKIESEESDGTRPLLSPQRAMLLQIVEDNFKERPIYFCGAEESFYGGLDKYFQYCGFTYRLLPFETENTDYKVNIEKLETICKKENLENYSDILKNDIQRITIQYNYFPVFYRLSEFYKNTNQKEKLQKLIDLYKEKLFIGFNKEAEEYWLEKIR